MARTRYKTKPSDHNAYEFLKQRFNIREETLHHFVQNGLCLVCNVDVREHIVVFPQELDSTFAVCWTEAGPQDANGICDKHFCVRSEDHPNRITRDEFEDLYGD